MNAKRTTTNYFELRPIGQKDGGAPRRIDPELLVEAQTAVVDADFSRGGTWAGVATLVERAYFALETRQEAGILEKHNYELHMVLARHRSRIPLKHGSLTDLAEGSEKTRNFPLDRAYRIAHGLVDFVMEWRTSTDVDRPYFIIIENFSDAQHLARRFFLDLARRGSERTNLVLIVSCESSPIIDASNEARLCAIPVSLPPTPFVGTANAVDVITSDEEAEQCLAGFKTLEDVELHCNPLLAYYQSTGNNLGYARAALAALHACNHYGYYYEASSFVGAVLPYFDRLVGESEENRWNYTGNLFHALVVQGAVDDAQRIIERVAEPFLTKKSLRAKMEYILGIVDLRHKTPPDLVSAEEHFSSAVALIRSASDELEPHEYVFLKVFIENGLAFLRVRQGRRDEAIELCQSGYQLLTQELGAERHKLHRSVLQYNTAQVYNMMGDLDAALRYYEQAILMDPNYSEYYNEMGNIYQRQERFDVALSSYDAAIRLSPPYPEVYFNRAVCLAREGRWEMALKSCDYSLDLSPNQPDAYVVRAEICEQMGAPEQALSSYDQAIALSADLIAARVNKAVLLFNIRSFDAALVEMNHVIAVDGTESSHYDNRAMIHKEMQNWNLYHDDQSTAELYRRGADVEVARSS